MVTRSSYPSAPGLNWLRWARRVLRLPSPCQHSKQEACVRLCSHTTPPIRGQLGFPRLVLHLPPPFSGWGGRDPRDQMAWSLGQASSGRTPVRRRLQRTASLLGTGHAIWGRPWGQQAFSSTCSNVLPLTRGNPFTSFSNKSVTLRISLFLI